MSGSNICTVTNASPSTTVTSKTVISNNSNDQNSSSKNNNNKCSNNNNGTTKQISFIKRFNPFGSSSSHTSSSSLKTKIDDIKQNNIGRDKNLNKNSEFRKSNEYRDVKSLKQFWNNHILSSNSDTNKVIKQKSATLNGSISAKCLENFSDKNFDVSEKKEINVKSRASSVPSLNIFKLKSPEKSTVKLKSYNSIDNFDKYKSAETVKNRRHSKEEGTSHENKLNFPLVATASGGTKIHWAKRDDLVFGKHKKSEMIIESQVNTNMGEGGVANSNMNETKKYNDEAPSKKGVMVSDMVDMVVSDPITKAKVTSKNSSESPNHQKVIRKISFRTTKNTTPTNSYSRRLNKHQENSSRVAALTLRFNEMVQQDASLLKEVQKNGGIVHKVGGHVYKIVEEGETGKNKRGKDSPDDASSVSSRQSRKKVSVRRKASMKSLKSNSATSREKSVKETIQIFEPSNNKNDELLTPEVKKPKVPDKSETVKLRSEVLRQQKRASSCSEKGFETITQEIVTKITPEIITESPDSNTKVLESKDDLLNNIDDSQTSHVGHYLKRESDHKSSKYSRMYEKMKFRSLFTSSTTTVSNKKVITIDCHEEVLEVSSPSIPDDENATTTPYSDSKVNTEVPSLTVVEDPEPISPSYQPNTSFLFRNATLPKNTYSSTNDIQSSLVEAINAALINKTRSMDEASFPHEGNEEKLENEEDFHLYTKNKSTLHEKNKLLSTIKVAESSTEAINEMCQRSKDEYEYIQKPVETGEDVTQESIYQSLTEARGDAKRESFEESYESLEEYHDHFPGKSTNKSNTTEDGYELCDPPEPPPPRKPSTVNIDSDTPLPLPAPKRVTQIITNDTYEHVKYTDIPPRPPNSTKPEQDIVPLPPRNGTTPTPSTTTTTNNDTDEHDYYEENIYDTIKHSDNQSLLSSCYEAIQQRSKMNNDTASLLYDSVKNEFNRFGHFLQHADSTLTLASDQKTNSIYGTTILGQNTPPSERGSDNSDDWVDISDDEGNNPHKFVV